MKPLFTIILPNYKTEFFLEQCLKSIKEQTFENYKVLLINDGSPGLNSEDLSKFKTLKTNFDNEFDLDNVSSIKQCEYIFKNVVGSDDRFSMFDKQNGGQSSARNYALKLTDTKYTVFVDCDDYLDKNYLLNASLKISKKIDKDIIFGSVKLIEDGVFSDYGALNKHLSKVNNLANLLVFPSWTPNPINYFWPTELIKKYNLEFPVGKKGEDTNFVLENILANFKEYQDLEVLKKFNNITDSIYYYRQFKEQMTKQADFEHKLFVDMSDHVESRIKTLGLIDFRYGVLARLFVTRFRLYNKRNNSKFLKIFYSLYGKILTILSLLIAKTF